MRAVRASVRLRACVRVCVCARARMCVYARRFVVFESNGWCFSNESCARRPANYTSSRFLPDLFPESDDGIFSIAGEQNPNFYKSYAVFVPHCSRYGNR